MMRNEAKKTECEERRKRNRRRKREERDENRVGKRQ